MGDCEHDARHGENRCKSSSEFPFDKSMEVDSTSEDIEHLGSINHCNEGDGTNLRSSARVSKKMRLDSVTIPVPVVAVVPVAAPVLPQEKKGQEQVKEEEKGDAKQPAEPKPKRRPIELWSHEDKNTFFEALNEFGKDFDAIQNHFAVKAKKKGMIELAKTKDQIRHFYYRTFHKVSKHLKFPEDLKKVTQEIYALVNYGEMRKKVSCITEKTSVKLNELISKGFTLIRLRGKTIRIRTPMCRALRKLNQLEELQEELKLPQRVIIELRPRDTETWAKVQATSQNPRARTTLPLQRRLSTLLTFLQYRWRPHHQKHRDKLLDTVESNELPLSASEYRKEKEPLLHLAPLSGANICMPSVNLNEYLTSFSLCLRAHEERRATWAEAEAHAPVKCGSSKKGTKRQPKVQETPPAKVKENEDKLVGNLLLPVDVAILDCNACDNDKKTFEKMLGNVDNVPDSSLGTSSSIDEAVNHILSLNQEGNPVIAKDALPPDRGGTESVETDPEPITPADTESKVDIVKETIERIRKGWTIKDAHAVSVGELYLMFGSNSKIQLEYWWEDSSPVSAAVQKTEVPCTSEPKANKLAVALQKLLSVAKLNFRKTKLICPCGHVCGAATKSTKNRLPARLIRASGDLNEKNKIDGEGATYLNNRLHPPSLQSLQDGVFRRPLLAPSQYKMMPKHDSSVSDFKAQLDKFRPRYCNRRGRSVRSKNVVVQRMLPLLPKAPNGHAMVTLKVIPQTSQLSGEFMPITSPSASVVSFPALGRQRSVLPKVQQAPSVLSPSIKPTVIDTNPGATETSTKQVQSSQEISSSPTEISSLLKLEIPSTPSEDIVLPVVNNGLLDVSEPSTSSFVGLLPSEGSLQLSTSSPPSPTRILKEDENQWLNSEVADFSLSSFLGHLESPMKSETVGNIIQGGEDTRMSSDVEAQLQCLMSENSIDYMAKFADLAAQIASDGTNKK